MGTFWYLANKRTNTVVIERNRTTREDNTTSRMTEINNKRKRIAHPILDEVYPLVAATTQQKHERFLPSFLHNALFSEAIVVPYENCPFKSFIDLGGRAWRKENESPYLIERPCYETLLRFLDERFKDFEVGIQQVSIITGTAGIGKTMFALYVARRYFQRGEFVVLYYEGSVWAFTKTSPSQLAKDQDATELDSNLLLEKGTQPTGQDFWYGQTEQGLSRFDEKLVQWKNSGCAIIIRDPGAYNSLEIYTVSAGQEKFLEMVRKLGIPPARNRRTAGLWSGEEFMYAAKLHLFWSKSPGTLDLEYVMEGYRRYGGSARSVLEFAETLKMAGTAKGDILDAPIPADTIEAIAKIAEYKVMGQEEAIKTKALLFHRSPVAAGYRIHFASPYLGQLLMKEVKTKNSKALGLVVAALSITTGHQDAYGVLYEDEVHKQVSGGGPCFKQPKCLGCHGPSQKMTKGILVKSEVSLDFARASSVYFPGKSLENAPLNGTDNLLQTYFHPITSNFPTHDSFLFCRASAFFSADASSLSEPQRNAMETKLSNSIVLVGLQMTVSGSDSAKDKPSHTVYGVHLTGALNAIRKSLQESHTGVELCPDVVTIFFSPMESCRKMQYMPVLTTEGTEMKTAIQGFAGMAPQYYAISEVKMIEDLMSSAE